VSLLDRLRRSAEQKAWTEFVDLYTPLLFHWARRLGLQESDAADLVQEVFAVLVQKLPEFEYKKGKRFRGWLWTILVNKHRERGRRAAALPVGGQADLEAVPGPDEAGADEAEYREFLVNRALELMKSDFHEATWKACWEYTVNGRPAAVVAAELGISVNAVHLAKSRVLRRLRQELKGLLE
jgi:RNA polymerase sigma-70 factor (ECF subfamily)